MTLNTPHMTITLASVTLLLTMQWSLDRETSLHP